ncbi:LPS export ABC transporter permease LptG [Terricaulis sp.]|uniref:LPS export ABC transporter permease LptG n=1 Tax=Terricaulis sp. TaxID=2768686 RepID=UPI002AC63DEC|nr:LPS export ABC transporter permease LptG [Terricaulis sp.]MDZ4691410.1 LPS export ABC transporter permease LptG [Terricaulis sp.]
MNFLFSRLGNYIIGKVIGGVAIALVAVLAAILLIDMVEQMRTVTDIGTLEALRLTLLKTPMLVEQTLPFVVLAGAMMAITGLNRSSELVAMRAAGVSAWRFLAPSAFVGAILGLIAITALNPLGAQFYKAFEAEREDVRAGLGAEAGANGVWIRQGDPQGQVVIHADGVDSSGAVLQGATFLFFEVRDDTLRFTRRMRAERAELKRGFWQLTDLVEATPGSRPMRHANLAIPTTLDASELVNRFVTPATLSFWELPFFIREARAAGFAPTRYELKWQSLLAYPLLLAVMAGLGAAFSLQLQRLGNLAKWGAMGVGIGLFLFFYSQLAGAFAMTQTVPAVVAAWSAPLAGMFIALAIVAFLEDG